MLQSVRLVRLTVVAFNKKVVNNPEKSRQQPGRHPVHRGTQYTAGGNVRINWTAHGY